MRTNKILSVIIFLFLSSTFLFPQEALKKGVYNLSGGITYSNSKNTTSDETIKNFNFSISPALNYFVIDNLLLGGSVSFYYSELSYKSSRSDFKNINRQFQIGPGIRYYFSELSFNPFIGASANYSKSISSEQEGNNISAMVGINYFISNSAAIEPYFQYTIGSYNKPDQDINTFSIGFRMNYFIVN